MSKKTIGCFDFSIIKTSADHKIPFDPIVEIRLQQWTEASEDGGPVLSPHLMSEAEIDEHISNLKADLDAVGSKAKRALQKARDETMQIVSRRIEARGSDSGKS